MSDAAYEVVVYGDAPDDGGGGGTDTISYPRDFITYYEPTGPTIVMPPRDPGPSGGGGDVGDVKDNWLEVQEKAVWISAGFTTLAAGLAFTGVGMGPAMGVAALAGGFGLAAYYAGNAASAADSARRSNYKRVAGSNHSMRRLDLTGIASEERTVLAFIAIEHSTAVFVDAIELMQAAFLAGDSLWTQRHADAAHVAWLDSGEALSVGATTVKELAGRLSSAKLAPAEVRRRLPALMEGLRPVLELSAEDEKILMAQMTAALPLGVPSPQQIGATGEVFQRVGRRLAMPELIPTRFEFVETRPVPKQALGRQRPVQLQAEVARSR